MSPFESLTPSPYFRMKSFVDWSLAAILLVLSFPLIGLLTLLVAVCDGRPIFYRQLRVGKDGRLFQIRKFRSMRRDAEKGTGAVWCSPNDSRITRLGYWLRKTHLDELPQLFNVLSGEMSVVGPRPERPEFVAELNRSIPDYTLRHSVPPGITGLAQIRQGSDTDVSDVARKVSFDLEYIQSASLLHDLKILLLTIPRVAEEVMEVATQLTWNRQHQSSIEKSIVNLSLKNYAPPIDRSLAPLPQPEDGLYAEITSQLQALEGLRNQEAHPSHPDAPRPKSLNKRESATRTMRQS